MRNPPDVSNASEQAILKEIQALVPQYTPEWRFSPVDPDAGSALMLTFIRMFSGNRRRFNLVPYRNLLSYLHLLGVEVRPARPAMAYVCLSSSKTSGDTYVAKGAVFGASTSGDDGLQLTFESDTPVQVTASEIRAMVVVNGRDDSITTINVPPTTESFVSPLDVFGSLTDHNLQRHVFYIGTRSLFQCHGAVEIRLFFQNSKSRYLEPAVVNALASTDVLWSYWDGEAWQSFDVALNDEGTLVLQKHRDGDIAVRTDVEPRMRWIRCEVRKGAIRQVMSRVEHYYVDGVECQVNRVHVPGQLELTPDYQICNNLEPDDMGYHPFGERFSVYNMWYVANDEALTKPRAQIELSFYLEFRDISQGREPQLNVRWRPIMRSSQFKMPTTPRLHIHQVVWEYFNGSTWVRLDVDPEASDLFHTGSGNRVTVRFVCPDDLSATSVKSRHAHWIRVRVLSMDTGYGAYNIFVSPWVDEIKFHYRYTTKRVQPDLLRANNNLIRSELGWFSGTKRGVHLFEPLDTDQRVLYLGLSEPLENGPYSLYWSLLDAGAAAEPNSVRWSYLAHDAGEETWQPLQVIDETAALCHSGIVRFMVTKSMIPVHMFNQTLNWLRCEIEPVENREPRILLAGIHMNGVRALQLARVQQESPASMFEGEAVAYAVAHDSLLEETVWIDETNRLTVSQLQELPEEIKQTVKDATGNIVRAWIKWYPVQSFLMSSPLDRHYVVDRQRGLFYFGDGRRGKAAPASATAIRIDYSYGGGRVGNVGRGSITSLKNAIPFIKDVYNPDAAYGGQDLESVEAAVQRGLQLPAHQNRGITASDFEWLAMDATPLVKEAKAISNVGQRLESEPGSLLLVILPIEHGYPTFVAARRAIEHFVRERSVNMLQVHRNLYITQPQYIRVSIHVNLIVVDMDHAVSVQIDAMNRLTQFTDTYAGGWRIGEFVHPNAIQVLLKSVANVELVSRITVETELLTPRGVQEISVEDAARMQHGMVTGGRHRVDIGVSSEGRDARA